MLLLFFHKIFRRENIRLVVVYMETWTIRDRIVFSSIASYTISRLRIFSSSVQENFDAMMLIT